MRGAHEPELIDRVYYKPHDYDNSRRLKLVDGEHDVFRDGSVTCIPIPTQGHTAGHQSLRLRCGGQEMVLTADACYLRRTLDTLHLPAVVCDGEAMLESLSSRSTVPLSDL